MDFRWCVFSGFLVCPGGLTKIWPFLPPGTPKMTILSKMSNFPINPSYRGPQKTSHRPPKGVHLGCGLFWGGLLDFSALCAAARRRRKILIFKPAGVKNSCFWSPPVGGLLTKILILLPQKRVFSPVYWKPLFFSSPKWCQWRVFFPVFQVLLPPGLTLKYHILGV